MVDELGLSKAIRWATQPDAAGNTVDFTLKPTFKPRYVTSPPHSPLSLRFATLVSDVVWPIGMYLALSSQRTPELSI
jgi:hypothetical protein